MPTTKTHPYLRPVSLPSGMTADSYNLWETAVGDFADRIAVTVYRTHPAPLPILKREAKVALGAWIASGPCNAEGQARFPDWNGVAALTAMVRRVEAPTLNCRRLVLPVLRVPLDCWRFVLGRVASVARLWREQFKAGVNRLNQARLNEAVANFVKQAVERHVTMTATWGQGPEHRQRLISLALIALETWWKVRERRGCDIGAVLLDRTTRARRARVDRFAFWPSSLLRDIRHAMHRHATWGWSGKDRAVLLLAGIAGEVAK